MKLEPPPGSQAQVPISSKQSPLEVVVATIFVQKMVCVCVCVDVDDENFLIKKNGETHF